MGVTNAKDEDRATIQ